MNETTTDSGGPVRSGLSPFCTHLASKKLMISSEPPLSVEDVLDASRHCWCSATMKILGPDDYECRPADCTKSRGCFESPLADLL